MTRTLVTAIVSTAAAGVERGALDAAIDLSLGHGGWTAEPDLPAIYAEHAKPTRDRGLAVRLNVQDSDGTLILSFAGELDGRAAHAGNLAKQQRKPAQHLVLTAGGRTRIPDAVRVALLQWIDEAHVSVLHVVGPSEEQEPGIQQATRDALVWIFEDEVVEAPAPVPDGMMMEPWQPIWPQSERARSMMNFSAISRFAGVDRSAVPESLQHAAEPPPLDDAIVTAAVRAIEHHDRSPTTAPCGHCGCITPRAAGELCQCGHLPSAPVVHLYRNQCHDESEVWCDAPDYGEANDDPGKVTCVRCLCAASSFGDRARAAVKPYRSGPLQQTLRIPARHPRRGDAAALGSWTLRLYFRLDEEQRTHWVDFELFEVAGLVGAENTLEYPRRGARSSSDLTRNLDEAEPSAQGSVKWDGCTQFDVAPVHVDSRSDLDNLFHGIGEARRLCAVAMYSTYDQSSEYP